MKTNNIKNKILTGAACLTALIGSTLYSNPSLAETQSQNQKKKTRTETVRFRPSTSLNMYGTGSQYTQVGLGTAISLDQKKLNNGGETFLKLEYLMGGQDKPIGAYNKNIEENNLKPAIWDKPILTAGLIYKTEELRLCKNVETHLVFGVDVQFSKRYSQGLSQDLMDEINGPKIDLKPNAGMEFGFGNWGFSATIGVITDSDLGGSEKYLRDFKYMGGGIFKGVSIGTTIRPDWGSVGDAFESLKRSKPDQGRPMF